MLLCAPNNDELFKNVILLHSPYIVKVTTPKYLTKQISRTLTMIFHFCSYITVVLAYKSSLFNIFICCFITAIKSSIGLHLTGIAVPTIADVRDSISLSCSYNLGADKLHSVKWYKDDREFFR